MSGRYAVPLGTVCLLEIIRLADSLPTLYTEGRKQDRKICREESLR
jgi:hypothetical protein